LDELDAWLAALRMHREMADILQTVEYSRDKWRMERVPRALLACLLGVVLIRLDPNPPGHAFLLAFVFMFVVAAVLLLTSVLFHQIIEGRSAAARLLALVVAAGIVVVYWDRLGDLLTPNYPRYPSNVPASIVGWMVVFGAFGWLAFALYRHVRPPRPFIRLSPAGISYDTPMIKNLLIPWHEVQDVGAVERTGINGLPLRLQDLTAVAVSQPFYEEHILARRGFMSGPNSSWNAVFIPKPDGSWMQIVLYPRTFAVAPEDLREPVAARWKAFRDKPPLVSSDAGAKSEASQISHREISHKIYGTWSIDGSLWQATKFLAPLIGIVAVLALAVGR
jgi:hypothetical protein